MGYYTHPNRILVALDCIIFGFDGEELKLLLIKRNFEPEQGRWSLMGGFLNEDEDLEAAAQRILYHHGPDQYLPRTAANIRSRKPRPR